MEELQHRACDQMLKDRDLVDAWMTPMNESFRAGVAPAKLPAMKDDEVRLVAGKSVACKRDP